MHQVDTYIEDYSVLRCTLVYFDGNPPPPDMALRWPRASTSAASWSWATAACSYRTSRQCPTNSTGQYRSIISLISPTL